MSPVASVVIHWLKLERRCPDKQLSKMIISPINSHKGKSVRTLRSALAVLGGTFILLSLVYFRVQVFEEPAEYEPRPEVQSSSWLGHAPRLEKAWARSATVWFPSLFVRSRVIRAVEPIPLYDYLFRSWLIRAPPVLSRL